MDSGPQRAAAPADGDTVTISGPSGSPSELSTSNPFSCNICKRSYTRVDHLARHYRSHTREKPFECETCGKGFARADLLKRHANGHNQGILRERPKGPAKPAPPRVARACLACADAKLRCEGNSPCGRCKNKGFTCVYPERRSKRSTTISDSSYEDRQSLSANRTAPSAFHMGVPNSENRSQSSNVPSTSFTPHGDSDPMMLDPLVVGQWQRYTEAPPSVMLDADQLPTTHTFDHGNQGPGGDMLSSAMPELEVGPCGSPARPEESERMDELPFADFLRQIMTPTPFNGSRHVDINPFQPHSRDLLDFNGDQSLGIDLNGFAANLFMPDQLFLSSTARIDGDERPRATDGYTTPGNILRKSVHVGQQAFRDSIWLWTPALGDHAGTENANLSLSFDHNLLNDEGPETDLTQGQLSLPTRDRILSMVLGTCKDTSPSLIVTCFPSPELLTKLVNICLFDHLRGDSPWIHRATLNVNEEAPEFLAAMVSTGATICEASEIRKLGFAFQEAVRLALPDKFEADNRNTRELRLLQAYAMHLDVSLWSGDRRKMEIAESFALPLITMMRRSGSFRRNRQSQIVPRPEDDEAATDAKWRKWVEAESFKRLALYLFLRDTQTSMSLLDQPLISFAEITLDLPFSRELWMAGSSSEWKSVYLTTVGETQDRHPTFRHCLHDIGSIFRLKHIVDVQMTLAVILSSIWALIWQYRKLKEALTLHDKRVPHNNSLTVNSLHQESLHLMQHVSLNATEWQVDMNAPATLLRQLCLMHLHVSLEDVQLLAGKEGEEEARRVFPLLSEWTDSVESRQAIFHAGQVLRAAKQYSKRTLREASAVAVYQASLVLWAYAIPYKSAVLRNTAQATCPPSQSGSSHVQNGQSVRLDADDGPEVQRFLVLGKGSPCIRRWVEGDEAGPDQDVPLADPDAVMNAIAELLRKKNGGNERSTLPLIANLSKLMKSLGTAAAAVRKK